VLGGRFQPSRADRYRYTRFVFFTGLHTTVGISGPGNPAREPRVIIWSDNGTVFVADANRWSNFGADVIIVASIIGITRVILIARIVTVTIARSVTVTIAGIISDADAG
jgi:hypothetical protein